MSKITSLDRFARWISPQWGFNRLRARAAADVVARHYEAAQTGRRTSGWNRDRGDINSVSARGLIELRLHARDLYRNNAWAKRGVETITGNAVGWGIVPKAGPAAMELWKAWADSLQCDADALLPFAGIQELAMKSIVEAGEILIRRRWRRVEDGFVVPMQLQVLEPDFIDSRKDGETKTGRIIQGVEFDKVGRRVGYWLFPEHPGSALAAGNSYFVPASEIIHSFKVERPSQVRGLSWFAQSITPLKDFDEYEDATLMRQKIAACFAAFVTDTDGAGTAIGEQDEDDPLVESFQPGMIKQLRPGQSVVFGNPPAVNDDGFTQRSMRRIAAGLGVTYEDLTGDYSQVNFSSARMARLAHWQQVHKWRYFMLMPQVCARVWQWFLEAADLSGKEAGAVAEWTAPPMPMIEPDKEGLAISRLVRNGVTTPSEMIREQGGDPEAHFAEYAADMARLDALKIKLDSDVRAVSQAGLTQQRAGAADGQAPSPGDKAQNSVDPELELSDREVNGDIQ